jgi:hypothetical protein
VHGGAGAQFDIVCRFIMNLTEAKSIGKRPSPQFTNYSFFKSQAARVLPLERLPGQKVRQAGRQGGRVPIIGMVYPRQNTAHSAVARLGLTTLKWRGLLENAVSLSQVLVSMVPPSQWSKHCCVDNV